MITHLLATDPTTPAGVLTYLADRHDLSPDDALALARHPNFPPAANLRVREVPARTLQLALEDPTLPAHVRRAFINGAPARELNTAIGAADCFTPDELAHASTLDLPAYAHYAFAANTRTPPDVARTAVAALTEEVRRATYEREDYPLLKVSVSAAARDAATIAHNLEPSSDDTRTAWKHPCPPQGYLEVLLERAAQPQVRTDREWWTEALRFNHAPGLVAAALGYADSPQCAGDVAYGIWTSVADNTRIDRDVRQRAADLGDQPAFGDLMYSAPAASLFPHSYDSFNAIAWHNPNVTQDNLHDLLTFASEKGPCGRSRDLLIAVALHPAASINQRHEAHAHLREDPELDRDHLDLVDKLASTGAQPGTALDVGFGDLVALLGSTTSPYQLVAAQGGVLHWAKLAWAQYSPDVTLEYTQALHGLAASGFSGTLRELLSTASAISKSPACTSAAGSATSLAR